MTEPTRQFFKDLAKRPHPELGSVSGAVRIDLADGERTEHWYLDISKDDVTVSHKLGTPDCTVTTDLATFEAMVTGRMNAMAAVLRGSVEVQGRFLLLNLLQRLFPGPPEPVAAPAAGYARRRA